MQAKKRKKWIIYMRYIEQYFLLEKQIIKKQTIKLTLKVKLILNSGTWLPKIMVVYVNIIYQICTWLNESKAHNQVMSFMQTSNDMAEIFIIHIQTIKLQWWKFPSIVNQLSIRGMEAKEKEEESDIISDTFQWGSEVVKQN